MQAYPLRVVDRWTSLTGLIVSGGVSLLHNVRVRSDEPEAGGHEVGPMNSDFENRGSDLRSLKNSWSAWLVARGRFLDFEI